MIRLIAFLYTLLSFITLSLADVAMYKPTRGSTYTVSGSSVTVPVVWIESNSDPKLTTMESYSFTICTGPNNNINGIKTLVKVSASDITGYSYDLEIPASIGADGLYYVQVYAVTDEGGYTIHYSYRFTLSGMTGTIQPSGSLDADPPSSQIRLDTGATSTMNASQSSASFALPYSLQTGITRYAPMQTQPGSKVSLTTWTRKFPTSSVSYYSTIINSLAQKTTLTPGWDYTISSAINQASPAPFPSENGGWYNPKSKLQTPSKRSSAALTTHTSA
ncbi:hypothetical protein WICPIJ_003623 [Wickerhamomyces pijperi]|uniref:Cell wall synthesis protein KRE9 n=1 Tax=Wickerhamomyces pijperi TaxID=599730 RepID=A0A9P8TNP2_WICPI|nr:hypothetical protein WICPIJ_003623 [Wickerhamomyces pijperi]